MAAESLIGAGLAEVVTMANSSDNEEGSSIQIGSILIVDDQRLVHTLEESMLQPYIRRGTRILHAFDGLEALKLLSTEGRVDLILLDINMPVLNGLAFLEQKQRTSFAPIPVVVISMEGDRKEEVAHALSLGASRVLMKPFTFEDLDDCVRTLLPRSPTVPIAEAPQ